MIGLDSTKKSFLDIYKMDLAETMKQVLSSKGSVAAMNSLQQLQQQHQQQQNALSAGNAGTVPATTSGVPNSSAMQHTMQQQQQQLQQQQQPNDGGVPGIGYVTEKLYMLLQLYLQNKGWNPSVELLQCFSELKDSALLPSAAYLQVLANRLALDTQGRLVLRESGKIVLPYEHFANAVMLKHMTGPHGLHLSVEATVRAVIESYTIGRENFGMEKEFIIEVVQSCPNPACRYYKNHLGVGPPFMDPAFQAAAAAQMNSDYMQHLPQQMVAAAAAAASSVEMAQIDLTTKQVGGGGQSISNQVQRHAEKQHAKAIATQQQQQAQAQQQQQQQAQAQQQQQQQITAAIIQQQNRAIAQQNLEKFGNLSAIEKQRVLQQLDKKHFEVAAAHVVANLASVPAATMTPQNLSQVSVTPNERIHERPSSASLMNVHQQQQQQQQHQTQHASQSQPLQTMSHQLLAPSPSSTSSSSSSSSSIPVQHNPSSEQQLKVNEFMRTTNAINMDAMDATTAIATNKDLLALHNGAWGSQPQNVPPAPLQTVQQQQQQQQQQLHQSVENRSDPIATVGQEKIIRAFGELMRNMARMKTFIRPSMCKPYGKQSDSLQKTLVDTIQLVQSLRGCLPAPHIPVSSWKSEDRHL